MLLKVATKRHIKHKIDWKETFENDSEILLRFNFVLFVPLSGEMFVRRGDELLNVGWHMDSGK